MSIKHVSSRDNAWFKRFRRAAERHDDEIVIEGRKQIADALRAGLQPIAIAASDESLLDYAATTTQFVFPEQLIAALSAAESPQGIVALCQRATTRLGDVANVQRALILDRVQDPGNVGTLVRLAAAFRCDVVIASSDSADPFSAKSLRAAVGTTFLLPVIRASVDETLAFAREHAMRLIAADGHAKNDLRDARFEGAVALVVGSEGEGLSESYREEAETFRIDIDPRVESLNVAAAAAIFLHAMR